MSFWLTDFRGFFILNGSRSTVRRAHTRKILCQCAHPMSRNHKQCTFNQWPQLIYWLKIYNIVSMRNRVMMGRCRCRWRWRCRCLCVSFVQNDKIQTKLWIAILITMVSMACGCCGGQKNTIAIHIGIMNESPNQRQNEWTGTNNRT